MSYFSEKQKSKLVHAFRKAQVLADLRANERFEYAIDMWINLRVDTDFKKVYADAVLQHAKNLDSLHPRT